MKTFSIIDLQKKETMVPPTVELLHEAMLYAIPAEQLATIVTVHYSMAEEDYIQAIQDALENNDSRAATCDYVHAMKHPRYMSILKDVHKHAFHYDFFKLMSSTCALPLWSTIRTSPRRGLSVAKTAEDDPTMA